MFSWLAVNAIKGWLFEDEARLLYNIASGLSMDGCIVEIGTYRGRSTYVLSLGAAESNRVIYAVDPHEAYNDGHDIYGNDDRRAFIEMLASLQLTNVIIPVGLPSSTVAKGWNKPVAMLWIDGSHHYEDVKADLANWHQYVSAGGYIAMHDTAHVDVSRALNEFLESHTDYTIIDRADSTTVMQKSYTAKPVGTQYDVSVLIPAYNASNTIEKAVLSALHQEGVNVQVIVCNDASTDETEAIIMGLITPDNHLDYCKRFQNQGLAAALNAAADNSSGRYIIELDADDWLEPGCLAKMVAALDANPDVGFVYGQTQYHGESDYLHIPQPYQPGIFWYGFASLYAFMYRREAWDNGCRYRTTCEIEGRKITIQDWDFALQLTEHMRWHGLALRDTLVLNYTYKQGSLTEFTNLHNAEVAAAFVDRWPMVKTKRI